MRKLIPLAIAAAAVSGCNNATASTLSAPDAEEMEQLKSWARQLKADDPDTARMLVRLCMGDGSLFSDEGKLQIARCMRRKYDEGERA